jgi:arylsulfatase A-like enzyme
MISPSRGAADQWPYMSFVRCRATDAEVDMKKPSGIVIALLPMALTASVACTAAKTELVQARLEDAPNILIVLTDDQRADRASLAVMPKMQRFFGEDGVHYPNAVATTPLCCPSRTSILSGQYAHNHGILDNRSSVDFNPDVSMQRVLDELGYQTGLVGKFFGDEVEPVHFDQYASMISQKTYFDAEMNINGEVQTVPGYLTTFMREQAIEFLDGFEEDDGTPWFMHLAPYAPHDPADAEPKYEGTHVPPWRDNKATLEKNLWDKPDYVRKTNKKKAKLKEVRTDALISLKSVDDMIAELVDTLRENGELDNTLMFFMSDNGYLWYEHGEASKRYPYDMSVRIPMFAMWKGKLPEGEVDPRIVANIDVAPTVFEAVGVDPGFEVDGKPLTSDVSREHILVEFRQDPGQMNVPTWAGLWSPTTTYIEYDTGEREYYTADDPWRLNNLLGNNDPTDDPTDVDELSELLDGYKVCAGDECP